MARIYGMNLKNMTSEQALGFDRLSSSIYFGQIKLPIDQLLGVVTMEYRGRSSPWMRRTNLCQRLSQRNLTHFQDILPLVMTVT